METLSLGYLDDWAVPTAIELSITIYDYEFIAFK